MLKEYLERRNGMVKELEKIQEGFSKVLKISKIRSTILLLSI